MFVCRKKKDFFLNKGERSQIEQMNITSVTFEKKTRPHICFFFLFFSIYIEFKFNFLFHFFFWKKVNFKKNQMFVFWKKSFIVFHFRFGQKRGFRKEILFILFLVSFSFLVVSKSIRNCLFFLSMKSYVLPSRSKYVFLFSKVISFFFFFCYFGFINENKRSPWIDVHFSLQNALLWKQKPMLKSLKLSPSLLFSSLPFEIKNWFQMVLFLFAGSTWFTMLTSWKSIWNLKKQQKTNKISVKLVFLLLLLLLFLL